MITLLLLQAQSAADASINPKLLRLYIVLDATDSEVSRVEKALKCTMHQKGVIYRIVKITNDFLQQRSTTFQQLFAVKINKTRTRKTLIKAPANYARMYIPDLFDELRDQLVVYLDSDVLISADLQLLRQEASEYNIPESDLWR